jgi:hypothetical protein
MQSRVESDMNKNIKRMTYRFNGNLRTQETVFDSEGLLPMHKIGEILKKNGRQWKVSVINHNLLMTGQGVMPVYRVYLTDAL